MAPRNLGFSPNTDDQVEVLEIMRAFDPEVANALWAAVEPLIPVAPDRHPLGCHRPRKSDRACFEVILVRLVTGCSWEDAEHLTGRMVSDTTARERRDEWIGAGVFDAIATEAVAGYDKIVGLDLRDVAVDGSLHKAPAGGEGTGKSPVDRAKLGWKWSIATDAVGIPIGWTVGPANCNDVRLLGPTLEEVSGRGLLGEVGTLWLDRGYDGAPTRHWLSEHGIDDARVTKQRKGRQPGGPTKDPMGLRWPVERTNSWLSNYGQMRRNTDRTMRHRLAQLALTIALLITAKLIDWRNRWSPVSAPIR
jgi:transposase